MNIASNRHQPTRSFGQNKLSVKERPKVVVLGGGYAGVTFIDSLGEAPVDLTLIDKSPNHVRKTKIWKATVGQPEAGAPPFSCILERRSDWAGLLASWPKVGWLKDSIHKAVPAACEKLPPEKKETLCVF